MTVLTSGDWIAMRALLKEVLIDYPTKTDLANELRPVHTELIDINLRLDRDYVRVLERP
jgi:hypothetical protein